MKEKLGIKEGDLHSMTCVAVDLGTNGKNYPVVSLFNSDFYVNNSYGSTVGGHFVLGNLNNSINYNPGYNGSLPYIYYNEVMLYEK